MVPLVRPVKVREVPVDVAVAPPGAAVTVYPVIALPPLDVGAVHETSTSVLPDDAVTEVGTPGVVAGVTDGEASEADPVPTELVAVTVKV